MAEDGIEEVALQWRRQYSDVVDPCFVGRHRETNTLVAALVSGQHPNLICIHGMGGVGKTSLAKHLYHHSRVRSHFHAFAWPLLSHQTDYSSVQLQIHALENQIQADQTLRYLVVLDDVWMDFTFIASLNFFRLPNVKVLITTRIQPSVPPGLAVVSHRLHSLSPKHSWELFQAKADFKFPIKDLMHGVLEKMLQYCDGLPLAITVLSDRLSKNYTPSDWYKIFDENFKTSTGVLFEQVACILSLGYKTLPPEATDCFKYFANFPKDCTIRMKELCQMYAATESAHKPGYRAEPYEYFKMLVDRSLAQVQNFNIRGEIKTLRVHNIIREVCCSKAAGILDSGTAKNQLSATLYVKKDVLPEFLSWFNEQNPALHSLMCFTRPRQPSYEQVMQPLFNRFRRLKVLKCENASHGYIGNLPEEIGQLTELVFLSLKGSHVDKVPSSIGNLVNLETLDLRSHSKWIADLPNVLWKLEKLRHLYLAYQCRVVGNEILRFGNLRFLETLVNIPLMCCDLSDLKRLKVKKLAAYFSAKWWRNIDPSSVMFLASIPALALENMSRSSIDVMSLVSRSRIEKLGVVGRIMKLTEDFPRLIKLTLNGTYLPDDPMATLEQLPKLRVLVLHHNSFVGSEMVCYGCSFSRLEYLSVIGLIDLEWFIIHEGSCRSLSYLLIENCRGLVLPGGLHHLTSLKKLVIKSMPQSFKMKLEREGSDFAELEFHDFDTESNLMWDLEAAEWRG